jgi:hypothetical protein
LFFAVIPALIHQLREETCDPNDVRLFIDSSKRSLKAVLLHNGNNFSSIPVAQSIHLKETYENLQRVLEKIKYHEHEWSLCGDIKVSGILLAQKEAIPDSYVSYANGIAERGTNIGQLQSGLKGKI